MGYSNYKSSSSSRSKHRVYSRFDGNRNRSRIKAYIDPNRFINKAIDPIQEEVFTPKHSFADFPITETLKRNILSQGYTTPTPIQDGSILHILAGNDLIGLANTGTGKTAAFAIPTINRLLTNPDLGMALIVAPTRELAAQIRDEFAKLAKSFHFPMALCVGGTSMHKQIVALRQNPKVVIGTPGRLKDLIEKKKLFLHKTHILVLDEVDRMLDMGFITDIQFLINYLPVEKQSLCFSATLTPKISEIMQRIQSNPITISVKKGETSKTIDQDIIRTNSQSEKMDVLANLLRNEGFEKVLVFSETKRGAQKLSDSLRDKGFRSQAIHGNKSQPQRQRALDSFKNNQIDILVATDVAARGIDVPNVSHVINYDQPNTYEDYIHRIGRTGRAGKRGSALTFVN